MREINQTGIPLLVIVGPTATGKTEVAVKTAGIIGGEVISADSMLVYRGMDIGTAKPTAWEKENIPHHMIDIVNPDEEFTVALYREGVLKIVPEVIERGRMPMLVGGTGLYVKAVIDGYNFGEAGSDSNFRNEMLYLHSREGGFVLHKRLAGVDPETALRLHPNDLKRIIRALEVYHLTGKPLSRLADNTEKKSRYNLLMYGLTMDREKLYRRIEKRVDKMIEQGLVNEVKSLAARGYGREHTSMQGLGYKEILLYLNGELSLDEAIELLKRSTRRFAKRQLTWFKRDGRINWLDVDVYRNKEEIAREIAKITAGVFQIASNNMYKKNIPTEGILI